ncbi:MAG: FAD:protein FMN transferase, partial [Ignavibacteriae bacterium]|nr:FAD:protein FMN transferase [Ignavibacteriota bacterium]
MEPRRTLRTRRTVQPIVHSTSRREFLRVTSLVTVGASLIPLKIFSKEILPLKEIKRAAYTMGSIVTFTAYHEDERLCNIAIDEAIKEMKTIDKLMSVFEANSQLSFVNRHSYQQEVTVDFRIIEVLEHAKKYYQLTEGAFDVTIEPLMQLYGFRDDTSVLRFPTDKQITDILDSVGMNKVTINQQLSTVNYEYEKTKIDFGGIAVGYALDRVVNILKKYGIKNALINHSGDIYALGTPP